MADLELRKIFTLRGLAKTIFQFFGLSANQAIGFDDNGQFKNVLPAVNAQTGSSYVLVQSDNGKVLTFENEDPIEVSVPNDLAVGFNCICLQLGTGQVAFLPDGSTTIFNRQSHTKIAGQYGVASLVAYDSAVLVLGGDTAE